MSVPRGRGRKHRRRGGEASVQTMPAVEAYPQQARGAAQRPAEWNWRTFPVYFGFATGIFLGVYAGYLAGFVQADADNGTPGLIVFIGAAILLGFGLARISTRFMMSRNWVKQRPKRR